MFVEHDRHLERARLPSVPVEHVHGAPRILRGREQDGAVTPRAVVGSQGDVGAQNGPGPAEEVFEVLPSDAVGELCAHVSQGGKAFGRRSKR